MLYSLVLNCSQKSDHVAGRIKACNFSISQMFYLIKVLTDIQVGVIVDNEILRIVKT